MTDICNICMVLAIESCMPHRLHVWHSYNLCCTHVALALRPSTTLMKRLQLLGMFEKLFVTPEIVCITLKYRPIQLLVGRLASSPDDPPQSHMDSTRWTE